MKLLSPKPKSLESDMADGRHIGMESIYNSTANSPICTKFRAKMLYQAAMTVDRQNLEFRKFKTADGLASYAQNRRLQHGM